MLLEMLGWGKKRGICRVFFRVEAVLSIKIAIYIAR
jgi:hypothetical protein